MTARFAASHQSPAQTRNAYNARFGTVSASFCTLNRQHAGQNGDCRSRQVNRQFSRKLASMLNTACPA